MDLAVYRRVVITAVGQITPVTTVMVSVSLDATQGIRLYNAMFNVIEENMDRTVKRTVAFTVPGGTTPAIGLMDHVTKDVILVTYHHCALKLAPEIDTVKIAMKPAVKIVLVKTNPAITGMVHVSWAVRRAMRLLTVIQAMGANEGAGSNPTQACSSQENEGSGGSAVDPSGSAVESGGSAVQSGGSAVESGGSAVPLGSFIGVVIVAAVFAAVIVIGVLYWRRRAASRNQPNSSQPSGDGAVNVDMQLQSPPSPPDSSSHNIHEIATRDGKSYDDICLEDSGVGDNVYESVLDHYERPARLARDSQDYEIPLPRLDASTDSV
ncbi:hypothetical protein PoB_002315200 [Plakobranchus ocellatus]|uniref:Uncharacterized protein n=1 Tax=Plakobranchus ocellatus TaxID=259542 RepID=A0AAV3ZN60_9GAST|nr:hypothetical protein PoB_002315200 [Plakobranchus ocellatus]